MRLSTFARKPGQAGLRVGRGLILQTHPSLVPIGFESFEVTIDIQGSRAWFPTAWEVCDLNVADQVRESLDRGLDLITVVGEMKEVEQQAHVRVAGSRSALTTAATSAAVRSGWASGR